MGDERDEEKNGAHQAIQQGEVAVAAVLTVALVLIVIHGCVGWGSWSRQRSSIFPAKN